MSPVPPTAELTTHAVINQPPPYAPFDLWSSDLALREHLAALGGDGTAAAKAGRAYANPALIEAAQEARRDAPRLALFNEGGQRLDEVRFNAGYHEIMKTALSLGYVNSAWSGQSGGHVTHAAHVYMLSQIEPGICCPLTMTYAAVPALEANADLKSHWVPKLLSGHYDPDTLPLDDKRGATLGMAMTEKQGGSDVRANTTRAEPDGAYYRLTGHKWFCSAPMSDGFLTLAQAPGGLTCFLVPRWLDGERNRIRLLRLKSKLGNHANASAEIEFKSAVAHRLGEEGAGVKTIIEMVRHTRLDTAVAPAGLMRAALREALHWATHRTAFQRRLIDQPLMRSVLADLALDAEGALAFGLHVASDFGHADPERQTLARIGVALAKFLNNKRCPHVVAEAMEVLGGKGYVEDSPMPMLYREAPLNGIWEGSGNVICLDVLRTLHRDPKAAEVLNSAFEGLKGQDIHFDTALAIHRKRWPGVPDEAEARWYAESLATLMTARAMMLTAPSEITNSFIASRLSEHRGTVAGSASLLNVDAILSRLSPQ